MSSSIGDELFFAASSPAQSLNILVQMLNFPEHFNSALMQYRLESVAAILYVRDMKKSLSFYVDVLGFSAADWGDENFTSVNRDNQGLYLCKGGQGVPGMWVWMGFDGDIHALHDALKMKGVRIKLPPTNYPWAYEMQV